MEKTISILLLIGLLISCEEKEISEVNSQLGNSNIEYLNNTLSELIQFNEQNNIQGFTSEDEIGKRVDLYKELLTLFDPDNFDCGCDGKLKKELRSYKPKNMTEDASGFIPKNVLNNAFYSDSALLLDHSGSSILAHGFQYEKLSGNKSKLLFAHNSPTVKIFTESDYIEKNPNTFDNFLYTLDCSGFLSAAVSAIAGVNKNSIKALANNASNINKSLIVVGGVMYSSLYQAYHGEGNFLKVDSITKSYRIKALEAIISAIPTQERKDTTKVFLNSNYRVVLTSNSGNSSFNGEAKLGITGGIGFVFGSVSGSGEVKGNVQRKSDFSSYKTYLIEENVNSEPSNITISSIQEKINALKGIP